MAVTVKDNGLSLLKARLAKDRPRVKVGIFGDAAAARANDSDKTVGEIAAAHEFGIGVPRRSWLNDTVDANQADILAGLRKAAAAVLKSKEQGLEAKLLGQTGQHLVGLMRQRISSGIAPALSERYLLRKMRKYPGATTPLIASGQMWGSIGAMVEGAPSAVKAQRAAARKAARAALARKRRERKLTRAKKRIARAGKKASRLTTRAGKKASRLTTRAGKKAVRFTKKLRRSISRQARKIKRGLR